MTGVETKLMIAAFLAGLGIVAPPGAFAGGMFWALAAAYLTFAFTDPEDKKGYVVTLAAAVVCGTLAALIQQHFLPDWPLHLMMAAGGGLSIYLVETTRAFGRGMIEEGRGLPGKLVGRFFGKGKDDA